MTYEIQTAAIRSYLPKLRIGDRVLLSGTIYTSRDAAHKRIFEALDSGAPLPILCRMQSSTMPAPHRHSLEWRLVPAVPPLPGGWTALPHAFWISAWLP